VFTADVSTPTATPTLGPGERRREYRTGRVEEERERHGLDRAERAKLIATAYGNGASSGRAPPAFREIRPKTNIDTDGSHFGRARSCGRLRAAHLHDSSRRDLLQLAMQADQGARRALHIGLCVHAHGNELVLEPRGRDTPHTRIPVGRGVCGTAVATGEDQNVADVATVGNYLACHLDTKSELVRTDSPRHHDPGPDRRRLGRARGLYGRASNAVKGSGGRTRGVAVITPRFFRFGTKLALGGGRGSAQAGRLSDAPSGDSSSVSRAASPCGPAARRSAPFDDRLKQRIGGMNGK